MEIKAAMELTYRRKVVGSLLAVGSLQVIVLTGLVILNPNHYVTIDSSYYLESARNIQEGIGYATMVEGKLVGNGHFPSGYSCAIAWLAGLTGLPVLIASKLVNLLALLSIPWLFYRQVAGGKAVACGSVLLLGDFLKIGAHTWSESLFLGLLTGWGIAWYRKDLRACFLLGIGLIWVRYAGVFIVVYTAFRMWKERRSASEVRTYGKMIAGWLLFFAGQALYNLYRTGHAFGEGRFAVSADATHNLVHFIPGLANELLLVRDRGREGWDGLAVAGFLLQLLWMGAMAAGRRFWKIDTRYRQFAGTLAEIAFTYLVVIIIIRFFSPFTAPGYRLLAPFTFLIVQSVVLGFQVRSARHRFYTVCLVVASWLSLLPTGDLWQKLGRVAIALPFLS